LPEVLKMDDIEEIVDTNAEEANVVVHTSAESNSERKKSIDSVDLMIEEEIKNIDVDDKALGIETIEESQIN